MRITKNKPLKNLNTFKIDLYADEYIEIDNIEELTEIYNQEVFNKKFLILGGGSNTLFINNFQGTVIHPNILGREIIDEDAETVTIKIGAGESWGDVVEWTVEQSYLGLQNLANIPGSCGAAPVQNIGAYGVEIKDSLLSVEYFDIKTGTIKNILNKNCNFAYRDSIFKHELKDCALITSITLKLKKWEEDLAIPDDFFKYKGIADILEKKSKKPYTIKMVFNTVNEIRNEKLPKVKDYGSCGSTFANPLISKEDYKKLLIKFPDLPNYNTDQEDIVKIPAAYILERLGWKNKRVGKCGTWIQHPLIVTNYEDASGKEIYDLICTIQKDFLDNTGITLDTEINIIF